VRSGLASLLVLDPEFSVVAQADAPEAALGERANPELLLWDAAPRAAAAARHTTLEGTPTLALVRDEDSALALLRAGVLGVLSRGAESERLLPALRAVASGLAVFEPGLLRALLSARTAPTDGLAFTPRETEVLSLMAEGLSNKLIGDRLKISEHTAKFHVNAILNKLGADTRTEAVVSAARRGLLML